LRDGSCGSGDHPSDHDAQFGCAEFVSDLPSSTFAFVLRRSTSFCLRATDVRPAPKPARANHSLRPGLGRCGCLSRRRSRKICRRYAIQLGGKPAFCLRPRTPQRAFAPGGHATATYLSAICSSARRPCVLRARDTYPASKMSSQGALELLPLLTAHSTWQHLQSLEDKERSPSREASS